MNKLAALLFALAVLANTSSVASPSSDEAAIRGVIASYQRALNDSDSEGIAGLFTGDAVVMLQGSPTSIGRPALHGFYSVLFNKIDLDLKFQVAEVVLVSPDWAVVRTSSAGTVKILSNSSSSASTGQELFVLNKQVGGTWLIARYAASSTK
jgi:uncharacterized protein (TIGR02246 family)